MNTIPEGKELVWAEAVYKEPIEGIPFSNTGLTVGVSKYVDIGEAQGALDSAVQRLVEEYFKKLSEQIKSTRNELVDKIRAEVSEEKDGIIEKAKEEYLKLREENKQLKSKLNK